MNPERIFVLWQEYALSAIGLMTRLIGGSAQVPGARAGTPRGASMFFVKAVLPHLCCVSWLCGEGDGGGSGL
ncbi:hypothetical protein ABZ622_40635, partial [Streptomyces sp. NPDC007164]|uniref:hypothetical protein n=1 Tax=Streptomyces sp. NPDC007164 TaxID=3156918 RepID=UPI0033D1A46D